MALSVALNWVAHREVSSWTETVAEDALWSEIALNWEEHREVASWMETIAEESATTVTEDSATTVRAPMHVGAGAEWAPFLAWLVLVGSPL